MVGVINMQNRNPHQHGNREIGLIATLGFRLGADLKERGWKTKTYTSWINRKQERSSTALKEFCTAI
jgi:hypothetical protein